MTSEYIPEFEVTVSIRNNKLKKRRKALGLHQKELDRAAGVPVQTVGHYETMKASPLTAKLAWKSSALKLAEFFKVDIWELFPPSVVDAVGKEKSAVKELSADKLKSFLRSDEVTALPPATPEEEYEIKELTDSVMAVLPSLTDQERLIIEHRFGLGRRPLGLKEVGELIHKSKERVRQLERRAMVKIYERTRKKEDFVEHAPHYSSRTRPAKVRACSLCSSLAAQFSLVEKQERGRYTSYCTRDITNTYIVPAYYCGHQFREKNMLEDPHEEECRWFRGRPDCDKGELIHGLVDSYYEAVPVVRSRPRAEPSRLLKPPPVSERGTAAAELKSRAKNLGVYGTEWLSMTFGASSLSRRTESPILHWLRYLLDLHSEGLDWREEVFNSECPSRVPHQVEAAALRKLDVDYQEFGKVTAVEPPQDPDSRGALNKQEGEEIA